MLKIKQTIIVEGKYDKIKLKSIVDANIITTDGFRIYNNAQKRTLIKNIAKKTGIIILTDSDAAGMQIRNFIKSCVGGDHGAEIINAYAPESGDGVEGTDKNALVKALERFGVAAPTKQIAKQITKLDFYNDGLSGKKNSAEMRGYLCERLGIPYMPSNQLLECVNILTDHDGYKKIVGEYNK